MTGAWLLDTWKLGVVLAIDPLLRLLCPSLSYTDTRTIYLAKIDDSREGPPEYCHL